MVFPDWLPPVWIILTLFVGILECSMAARNQVLRMRRLIQGDLDVTKGLVGMFVHWLIGIICLLVGVICLIAHLIHVIQTPA